MFVGASFRGRDKGVAQALIEVAKKWAADHDFTSIYLGTTAQFQAAHRFYEKNGFDEILTKDLPAIFPIVAVDTRFYRFAFPCD